MAAAVLRKQPFVGDRRPFEYAVAVGVLHPITDVLPLVGLENERTVDAVGDLPERLDRPLTLPLAGVRPPRNAVRTAS